MRSDEKNLPGFIFDMGFKVIRHQWACFPQHPTAFKTHQKCHGNYLNRPVIKISHNLTPMRLIQKAA